MGDIHIQPLPKRPPVVQVQRWINSTTYVSYVFVGEGLSDEVKRALLDVEAGNEIDLALLASVFKESRLVKKLSQDRKGVPVHFVHRFIYPDDDILTVLSKLRHYIVEHDKGVESLTYELKQSNGGALPYAWKHAIALGFSSSAASFSANPWTAMQKLKQQNDVDGLGIRYTLQEPLYRRLGKDSINNTLSFNVVFAQDLKNPFYFPTELMGQLLKKDELVHTDELMMRLWRSDETVGVGAIWRELNTPMIGSFTLRGRLHLSTKERPLFLLEAFDRITTSSRLPLVQCCTSFGEVTYKVSKDHMLPEDLLLTWMSADKIPKAPGLVIYVQVDKLPRYLRLFLDPDGGIHATCRNDARYVTPPVAVFRTMGWVQDHLSSYLGSRLKLYMDTLQVRQEVQTKNVDWKRFAYYVDKQFKIFKVGPKQDSNATILVKFLRTGRDKVDMNIEEYIHTMVIRGMSLDDILADLEDMGITNAKDLVQANVGVFEATAPVQGQKKTVELGMTLLITKTIQGLRIVYDNATHVDDVRRAMHFIMSIIDMCPEAAKAKPKPNPTNPTNQVLVVKPPIVIDEPKPTMHPELNMFLEKDIDDDFVLGGAGAGAGEEEKEQHKQMTLQLLQLRDPVIFKNPLDKTPYARHCQASGYQQPVVLSDEEKKKIDELFPGSYDNSILYGSDPSKQNHYACPRIWCPKSHVSMTPEQHSKNNGKCPDGENAVLMYKGTIWGDDPTMPHYVGFHANKSDAGFCLPCCYKKKPKTNRIEQCIGPKVVDQVGKQATATATATALEALAARAPSAQPSQSRDTSVAVAASAAINKVTDDSYLFNMEAPVVAGRWGTLPKQLHKVLSPEIPYDQCRSLTTTRPCYVRKGLPRSVDSFTHALAVALGYKNKGAFVAAIHKWLDPLTFIQLEGGAVLRAFSSTKSTELSNQEKKGLVQWLSVYKKYAKQIGASAASVSADQLLTDAQYIREIYIMKAMKKFLNHLQGAKDKTQHILSDLVYRMHNVSLLVWERQGENVQLRCPLFTKVQRINYVMIIHTAGYYEPISFRSKKDGDKYITRVASKQLVDMIATCNLHSEAESQSSWMNYLSIYQSWVDQMLLDGRTYTPHEVIVAPNLRVVGFRTIKGLYIEFPNQGASIKHIGFILSSLGLAGSQSSIRYQEDIAGEVTEANVFSQDMEAFVKKLKSIKYGVDVLVISPLGKNSSFTVRCIMPSHTSLGASIIPTERNSVLAMHSRTSHRDRAKWMLGARQVGLFILKNYDSLKHIIMHDSPDTHGNRVKSIVTVYDKANIKREEQEIRGVIVESIIEDIVAMRLSEKALYNWVASIGFVKKIRTDGQSILETPKEYIFSQSAVDRGMESNSELMKVLHPKLGYNRLQLPTTTEDVPIAKQTTRNGLNNEPTPNMVNVDMVTYTPLFSKWKTSSLGNLKVWALPAKNYKQDSLMEFFTMIAKQLGVPLDWAEVERLQSRFLIQTVDVAKVPISEENIRSLILLFADPSLRKNFLGHVKKDVKMVAPEFVSKVLLKSTSQQNMETLLAILQSGKLWATDICIRYVAILLQISILVIHRTPYGSKHTVASGRANQSDWTTSATLFPWRTLSKSEKREDVFAQRPVLILKRDYEDTHSQYSIVAKEGVADEGYLIQYANLQKDIQELFVLIA